jgi:hypothetical protein
MAEALAIKRQPKTINHLGEVAEWSIAAVLKTASG